MNNELQNSTLVGGRLFKRLLSFRSWGMKNELYKKPLEINILINICIKKQPQTQPTPISRLLLGYFIVVECGASWDPREWHPSDSHHNNILINWDVRIWSQSTLLCLHATQGGTVRRFVTYKCLLVESGIEEDGIFRCVNECGKVQNQQARTGCNNWAADSGREPERLWCIIHLRQSRNYIKGGSTSPKYSNMLTPSSIYWYEINKQKICYDWQPRTAVWNNH